MAQNYFKKLYKDITPISTNNLVGFRSFGMRGSNKTPHQQHTVRNQPIQGDKFIES